MLSGSSEESSYRTVVVLAAGATILAVLLTGVVLVGSGCQIATCQAAPVCDQEDRRVTQCPQGESCYQRSLCQTTITCVDNPKDAGVPDACTVQLRCRPGDRSVAVCPDGGNCYERSACGQSLLCLETPDAGPNDACAAASVQCPGNDRVVTRCPDTGSCYELSTCGTTVQCLRVPDGDADAGDSGPRDACLAAPTCDPGDGRVAVCPDGGSCYERTRCGRTITCVREVSADAGDTDADTSICFPVPTCQTGHKEVQYCPDGGSCYTRSGCGKSVTCLRQSGADADTSP